MLVRQKKVLSQIPRRNLRFFKKLLKRKNAPPVAKVTNRLNLDHQRKSAVVGAMRETGYNLHVPRAAILTLLVACLLSGATQAQRAGAAFHGNSSGPAFHSGFGGQRSFPNRSASRHGFPARGFRRGGFGSYFFPYYDEPIAYDQPEPEAETNEPPVLIPRMQAPPIPEAQVIEIPRAANATAKELPPTVFILANGERLEARRFVLTASLLSVSIDRRQRTVPLDLLDLNATLATNHERGVDLQIPNDRNEISVSF